MQAQFSLGPRDKTLSTVPQLQCNGRIRYRHLFMPPRSRVSVQRLSSLDLPILPFLAPRVFKPWPLFARKSHFASQQPKKDTSFHGRVAEIHNPCDNGSTGRPHIATDKEFQSRYKEIWGVDYELEQHSRVTERELNNVDSEKSTWRNGPGINHIQTPRLNGNKLASLSYDTARIKSQISRETRFGRRLPATRPKFMRLTPAINFTEHGFSDFWNTNFALLNLRHYRFLRNRRYPRLRIVLRNRISQRLSQELLEGSSISAISEIWQTVPLADRGKIWPKLLLATLSRNPDSALKLLAASYSPPYLPNYAVADSLDFIACHYLRRKGGVDTGKAPSIFEVTMTLLGKGPPNYLELTQNTIYLLLSSLDATSCKTLYSTLAHINHPLHRNTLMQFTSRLAHFGEIDLAFETLRKLKELGTDFNLPQMASICTTLLHHESWSSDSNSTKIMVSESELFEFMLHCGFKPNIITFNVLIQNALRIGDYETAWRIHDMMAENGVDADGFTYSILLHDAKLDQDRQAIQRVVEIVREKGLRNAHIITDFLHAVFSLHPRRYHRPSTRYVASETTKLGPDAWDEMCPIYCKYFKVEPLLQVIPSNLPYRETLVSSAFTGLENTDPSTSTMGDSNRDVNTSSERDGLRDPSVPTIFVMLVGLLNSFTKPRDSKLFYEHFQSLVLARDPAVANLTDTAHVYNIILLALGQFSENTSLCSRLIGDMLPPKTIAPAGSEEALDSPNGPNAMVKVPKPDIYTWSILLKVFIDNQQARAAEKVLSIMQSHSITPNHVTWKSLVSGYARMNDPIMVAKTLSRLRDAGIESEEITRKALELTKDYTALIAAMKAERPKRSARKGKFLRQTLEVLDRATEVLEEEKQAGGSSLDEAGDTENSTEPVIVI